MRLRLGLRWIVVFASFSGCSSFNVHKPSIYKNSLYDVKGSALGAHKLSHESELANINDASKADYHFTLAETYSLEGKWAEAVENFKLTLIYNPSSSMAHFRLANEYVRGGVVSEALEHCEKALKIQPEYEDAHLLLASLQSVMGFHEKARARYKALLKKNPNNHEAAVLIGASYVDEGRLEDGIKHFEALTRTQKSKTNLTWYYLGKTYLQLGKASGKKKAERAFKKSILLEPKFVQSVIELGQLYESTGEVVKAEKLYVSYQKGHGPSPEVAQYLSQIYLDAQNYEKALGELEILTQADPENMNIKLKKAFILVDQKKFTRAIPELEAILHAAPESDRVRFYLGAVYEEMKNYKFAIQQFREIPVDSKYFAEALMHRAYLYKLQDNMDMAINAIERNIKFVEDDPKVYALYASLYDEKKEYRNSARVLEKALTKFPEDTQILYQLGSTYDQLGMKDKTVQKMERLIEVDPNHVEGLNYLAFLYADKTHHLNMAEKLARKALSLRPGDGYIMDTLGWVLYKQDKTRESIRLLEQAHKVQGAEAIIAEHLGDAYFKIHLPNKAKEMYKRAITNEVDSGKQKIIRAKIDTINLRLQSDQQIERQRLPASN